MTKKQDVHNLKQYKETMHNILLLKKFVLEN